MERQNGVTASVAKSTSSLTPQAGRTASKRERGEHAVVVGSSHQTVAQQLGEMALNAADTHLSFSRQLHKIL